MEDTRCGEDCCFVKSGFCNKDSECPNYTETIWEEASSGKTKIVKDCAPKRTMIEQQNMTNSFNAVTASNQVLRDKIDRLEGLLLQIIQESKIFFAEIEEGNIKALEYQEKKNENFNDSTSS